VLPGVFADGAHGLLWGAAYSSLLTAACVFDISYRRIPNWLVLVLGVLGLLFTFDRHPGLDGLRIAGGGIAVGIVWIVLAFLIPAGGLGMGDAKLITAGGIWLGAMATLHASFWLALIGGVFALVAWPLDRKRRARNAPRVKIPYGVPIALGFALVAWLGMP
jgi:Flp pilus assembly protein protease CpaA